MFALFEDDFTIIHGTAGFAAFGSSTSGYGYSPPSATLSRDDNQLKMCLLCTCERLERNKKALEKGLVRKDGRLLVVLTDGLRCLSLRRWASKIQTWAV